MSRPHTQPRRRAFAPHSGRSLAGRLLIAASLWAGLALAGVVAQDGANPDFDPPSFERKLFDFDSIFIEIGELTQVTDALAALASNFPADAKVTPDLRARSLAIALRLNGVHRAAAAALGQLTAGEPTEAVPGFDSPTDASKVLWDIAEALDMADASQDDQLLACYLMDIAARVDPDREGGLERFQQLALKGDFRGWFDVVTGGTGRTHLNTDPDPNPDPDPDPLAVSPPPDPDPGPKPPPAAALGRKQGVGQMLAIDTSKRQAVGRVTALQASTIIGTLDTPMKLRFLNEDGSAIANLVAPAAFAPSALASVGVGWPANGGSITISVEGTYEAANGEGIAVPAALLVGSLITGKELVPDVLTLGALGDAGEVRPVARLVDQLRGVDALKAPVIVVPSANLPQLYDLAIAGNDEVFLAHQIFAVKDFAGVAGIAVEQSDDLKRARLDFSAVQELALSMPKIDLITNARVQERFEKILKLAPDHASAKVLLAAGTGKLPANMTLEGSLAALDRASLPVLKVMEGGGDPVATDLSVFARTKSSLSALRTKIDTNCIGLSDTITELVGKIEEYSRMNTRVSTRGQALRQELTATWSRVKKAYATLRGGGAPETPSPATSGGTTEGNAG